MKKFFRFVKYNKFKKIIFVSHEGEEIFKKIFPDKSKDVIMCNNLIDYNKINEMSKEKINVKLLNEYYVFLNVGRHEEHQKKLTRLIEATKKLVKDDYNFVVLMVGDGPDTEYYKKIVKESNIDNYIKFLGRKKNPYPYFKLANAVILTSDYEGYPVVFVESLVMKKPIITTNISDAKKDIENKYGVVTEKNIESVYKAMKQFIEKGFNLKEEFSAEKFNKEILKKLEEIF